MDGRVVSQGVLVVSAVRDDGLREILAVEVADTESEATYQELFRSLKGRGLRGVELVVSDDHAGLKAAIARHFQGASHQRCQVHYARNLLGMVGHAKRKELAADLRAIFAAPALEPALKIASSVAEKWRQKGSREGRRAPRRARRGVPRLPGVPRAPPRRIRTTNGLERLNQEIKRRTRVVRIFPNPEACLRLVTAWRSSKRGVGHGQALPGHGRARRTSSAKSGEPRRWCSWSVRRGIGLGGNYRNFGT